MAEFGHSSVLPGSSDISQVRWPDAQEESLFTGGGAEASVWIDWHK